MHIMCTELIMELVLLHLTKNLEQVLKVGQKHLFKEVAVATQPREVQVSDTEKTLPEPEASPEPKPYILSHKISPPYISKTCEHHGISTIHLSSSFRALL